MEYTSTCLRMLPSEPSLLVSLHFLPRAKLHPRFPQGAKGFHRNFESSSSVEEELACHALSAWNLVNFVPDDGEWVWTWIQRLQMT